MKIRNNKNRRPTMIARLFYFKKLRQKFMLFKRFPKRRFNLRVLKVSKELSQSVNVRVNILSNSFIKTRRKFKGVRRQRRVYPNTRFTKFYFKKLIYFKALIKRNFLFTIRKLYKSKRKNFNFSTGYKLYQKNGFFKSLNFFEFFLPNVLMHSFRLFNFNIAKKLISQGAVIINNKQITYKNYNVKLGDIIHLQPKFMYSHLYYFNFVPFGFLLYLQTKWKWSYYQIINFKTLHAVYYAPILFMYPKKKRWLKKKWLAFFFYFVK